VETTINKKTAVYVDGYNLYYGRLRNSSYKWLDLVALFSHVLKVQDPSATLSAVRLFTAHGLAKFASHGQASVEAQQAYHRALLAKYGDLLCITYGSHSFDKSGTLLPSFIEGHPYNRTVQSRVWKIEEKQTDVNLAMAMYRDAARGLFDQVIICSNDSDAEPVLAALREDFPNITIGVVTPIRPPEVQRHRAVSTSLMKRAHWTRKHILDDELALAQLPEMVPTKKKPIFKPSHW